MWFLGYETHSKKWLILFRRLHKKVVFDLDLERWIESHQKEVDRNGLFLWHSLLLEDWWSGWRLGLVQCCIPGAWPALATHQKFEGVCWLIDWTVLERNIGTIAKQITQCIFFSQTVDYTIRILAKRCILRELKKKSITEKTHLPSSLSSVVR